MAKYHVTYSYLATGMEGIADKKDFGFVEAGSEQDAKLYISWRETGENWKPLGTFTTRQSVVDWTLGCLTAQVVG